MNVRFVFWAEDADTDEVIGEKHQLIAVIQQDDITKLEEGVRSRIPDAPPELIQRTLTLQRSSWFTEVVCAAFLTVFKALSGDLQRRYGYETVADTAKKLDLIR